MQGYNQNVYSKAGARTGFVCVITSPRLSVRSVTFLPAPYDPTPTLEPKHAERRQFWRELLSGRKKGLRFKVFVSEM